jgi:hypothetical protein
MSTPRELTVNHNIPNARNTYSRIKEYVSRQRLATQLPVQMYLDNVKNPSDGVQIVRSHLQNAEDRHSCESYESHAILHRKVCEPSTIRSLRLWSYLVTADTPGTGSGRIRSTKFSVMIWNFKRSPLYTDANQCETSKINILHVLQGRHTNDVSKPGAGSNATATHCLIITRTNDNAAYLSIH